MVNIVNLVIRTGRVFVGGDHDAWWWLVFGDLEFGPVTTDAMAQLCADGVVREDTLVRSTQFRRRVRAADVPALLPQINPIAADPMLVQEMLRGIPSRKAAARWHPLQPLGPAASVASLVVLVTCAGVAVYVRRAAAPIGAAAAAQAFVLPLLAGWLGARVASRVTREKRWATLCGFWLAAAPLLAFAMLAPLPRRDRAAAAESGRSALATPSTAPAMENPAPGTAARPAPAVASGDSDDARLRRVAHWAVRESADAYLRYDETIRKLALSDAWQPARAVDPANYPDARRRCDEVRRSLASLGERLERVHAGVDERVRSSGASAGAQERFRIEYATQRDEARAAQRAFAAGEAKLLAEIESLLAFLGGRAGTDAMAVQGGRLVFRDRADAEAFSGHARRLTSAAADRAQRAAVKPDPASKQLTGTAPAAADIR